MRRAHEATRDWKPCVVCGARTPYIHHGKRYCVRVACQLAASKVKS